VCDSPLLLPAIRSLERRARYLFYCMFFCLFFVRSTISRQPAGRFTPKFACGRTLVPDVSSPLLGVGGPRRAEKGANEIFVTMRVNEDFFAFWRFLSDIPATRGRIHTKFYLCRNNVSRRAHSHVGCIGPWGTGEGELKTQKIGGWSHLCIRQLPFLFFSALPNVVQYVGHRPAHTLTFWCRTVKVGQGVSTGWSKKFEKKIRIFHHFETLYLRNYYNRGI